MNRLILAVLVSALSLSGRQAAAQEAGAAGGARDVAGAPQTTQTSPADARRRGGAASITGRVVTSEGNFAVANARVLARAAGAGGASSVRMTTTDDEGNFQLTDLGRGNYLIRVAAPGYISEPAAAETPATLYRPGETVTLRMVTGGVITGRVLDANGEPLTMARVRAVRVKDPEGRPVRDSGAGRDWMTDDRGVYRLYGLEPGAYVVAAGPSSRFRPGSAQSRSAGEQGGEAAPTYYPSSTLDAATHVNVHGGQETRGVDIRYRAGRSYSVRGAVVAPNARGGAPASRAFISITLSHAATGLALDFANITPAGASTLFNFDGVPDGVYELTALTAPGTSDAAVAPPQRVTVRGASVSDVLLTLTPFGSVAGRVLLETTGATEAIEACRDARAASVEETLVSARRDEAGAAGRPPSVASLLPVEAQPDARGEFALTNVGAGRYALDVRPPGRLWYVRDIAPANAATTTDGRAPVNLTPGGLTLKLGERVQGLTVRLAPGAASVAGRVSAAAGAALPGRLRVYAVPAERERADDALRYAGTRVRPDGAFAIEHLAPGRYWLLARASSDADDANENAGGGAVPGATTRAALRRDAESANHAVELQPCRQVTGHALRFGP